MALLAHLESTDATLSTDDLELNLMCLVADAWTPDEPFKNLWVCIKHLHAIANASGDPLVSDSTFMRLIVSALEQAGVSTQSIQTWRDRTDTDCTWAVFPPTLCMATRNVCAFKPPPLQDIMVHMPLFRPTPEDIETTTKVCFASIIASTRQICTDQTGKFIIPSSTGNKYVVILYD